MSRNIVRRSKLSGLASSDLLQEYVVDRKALAEMAVTDTMDGTLIYVKATKDIYSYESDSSDAEAVPTIIRPTSHTSSDEGRWYRLATAVTSSGNFADPWVDPTHALLHDNIVVLDTWEVRRGQLTIESNLIVQNGAQVYVTDGMADTKRPDFHQTNWLRADVTRSIPSNEHLIMHTTPSNPFVVDGTLNVWGDLVCLNFHNVVIYT